jgi:hypothetical protein
MPIAKRGRGFGEKKPVRAAWLTGGDVANSPHRPHLCRESTTRQGPASLQSVHPERSGHVLSRRRPEKPSDRVLNHQRS